MRLIDADALIDRTDDRYSLGEIGRRERDDIVNALEYAPSAQPKTGKWIIEDNPRNEWYRVTCSECGEDVTSTAPCIEFPPNAKVTWDYCPYCGAKMDGGTP